MYSCNVGKNLTELQFNQKLRKKSNSNYQIHFLHTPYTGRYTGLFFYFLFQFYIIHIITGISTKHRSGLILKTTSNSLQQLTLANNEYMGKKMNIVPKMNSKTQIILYMSCLSLTVKD